MSRAGLVAALALFSAAVSSAATLPPGFVETPISGQIPAPAAMAFAPDGRLFVCTQAGAVRVIRNGQLLLTPFVTLTVDATGERGLLGIAFDPAFDSNQFLYLYYTATSPTTHNRVSRFTASGDVVVPGSEIALADLEDLGTAAHNGGA
ncbi:MAG: PQQ-dependent sugar dehydrogenase, partial [Thermoanaerobaculia bacterium]